MTQYTIAKPTNSVLAKLCTDKQVAEQATIHSFLNCYFRETKTGELITTTQDPTILEIFSRTNTKSLICCQLTHQNIRLLIALKYYSPTGRHLFAFPIYYQVDQGNLLALDYITLIALTTKELSLGSGSKSHQDQLILRVIQSCNHIQSFVQKRRPDVAQLYAFNSNFIAAEQALIFGHNLHPTPKSRQGFAEHELSIYSPELKGSFPLHYFRAHLSIVQTGSGLQETAIELIKSEIMADPNVNADFKNSYCGEDEYALLPIHPWQANHLSQQPEIQKLIQQGILQDLGLVGRAYQPTSSIRTVYHPEAALMLKLSLNVKITNSLRTNLYKELERSLEVHKILAGKIGQQLSQHFPDFKIITDPAYITLKIDGVTVDGFSTILRENPFLNNPQTDATCVVALCQDAILGNGSRLTAIIQQLAAEEKRSPDAVSLDWFNRYLQIYLEPILWLYFTYGIGLEAHQQNSIVQLKAGYPEKFFYRDNQGYYYRRSCHKMLDNLLPGISQKSETICDDDVIDERLGYYLFFNNLFGLINAFGVAGVVDEELLLNQLRNALVKYSDYSLVKNLLSQPQLRCKANLLTRFHDMDELVGPVSTQSVYVAVNNPLYKGE
ncbi:IucA/IucC family siderophore biosynthesis protein [Nodularia harveyana UHCC-0300]|uniref:IucA/IucC family siderophore biosynthesis protein n=1 Tax=Nodularia harveyana UHCC-0300 TaxID=2974287 RepID=A0ABU5UJ94_9CYAN|nr:IucA/IucC family siderophore biosynthesis protein [Nodularia harveyana]MEA5583642.1 IucA/IucC family siderophore biosynthesis protein [Nodularia harveyana UHCC-0300]